MHLRDLSDGPGPVRSTPRAGLFPRAMGRNPLERGPAGPPRSLKRLVSRRLYAVRGQAGAPAFSGTGIAKAHFGGEYHGFAPRGHATGLGLGIAPPQAISLDGR